MPGSITHVVPVFKPGGAELQLATLAGAQAARGDDVTVLCLAADDLLRKEMEVGGVQVCSLRQDGLRSFVRGARAARRGNVIHSWMYHGFLMGAALRPFGTARHVWGVRRTEPFSPGLKRRTRAIVRLGRFLAPRSAHALVFCSETTMDRHVEAGFRAPQLIVTLNAIPPKFLEPRPPEERDGFVVGCLTRWTFDKGIDVLLRAWANFIDAGGTGTLLLAGPGIDDSNDELVEMVALNGVGATTQLVGPFREPRDFHRSLDVYVSPSRTEGFPNVVAEAMATGIPVVATAVGGTHEVMGPTGFLVDNEDHAAITDALLELQQHPELRAQHGEQARRRCEEEFTVAATEAAVRQAYIDAGAVGLA